MGEVAVMSVEAAVNMLRICTPILEKTKGRIQLIILPMPRFIAAPCCNHLGHCTNRNKIEYYSDIKDRLSEIKEAAAEFLTNNGWTQARVVDPLISIKGLAAQEIWGDNHTSLQSATIELIASSVKKIEANIMGSTKRKAEDKLEGPKRNNQVELDHKGQGHQVGGYSGGHRGHHGNHRGKPHYPRARGHVGLYRGGHRGRDGHGGGHGRRGW